MLSKDYILGFVEGEGCFFVSLQKNIDRKPRSTGRRNKIRNPCLFIAKVGFRVTSCDFGVINELRDTFGFGAIQIQKRANERINDAAYFYTKSLAEAKLIRDYFKDLKFHTSKGKDFEYWCGAIDLIESKQHITREGLLKLCRLRDQMNQRLVKKKWTTKEVEAVLDENPVHILEHFDPDQHQLLHNTNQPIHSWLGKKQGNNHSVSVVPPKTEAKGLKLQ